MTPAIGWAILIGLAFGLGLVITAGGVRSLGPVALADRIAPAVASVSSGARAHLQARRDRSEGASFGRGRRNATTLSPMVVPDSE